MKNLLITGGCGFIGSNFINYIYNLNSNINIINIDAMYYCANENNVLSEIRKSPYYHFIKGNINGTVYLHHEPRGQDRPAQAGHPGEHLAVLFPRRKDRRPRPERLGKILTATHHGGRRHRV